MRFLRVVSGAAALMALSITVTACASTGATSGSVSATSSASSTPIAGTVALSDAAFVASLKSKKFYPVGCQTVKLIKPADQIGFASAVAAEKAGFEKDLYSSDCRY